MARFTFAALAEGDLDRVAGWLARPHVAEWWPDPAAQLADIREAMASPAVEPFRVDCDGRPIGYVQRYDARAFATWRDQPPGSWGIDQFIGEPDMIGRGLGTEMVRAFVATTFARKGAARIITDPDPANRRAVRCYEKAGFRAVGELDTPWGRTLLMTIERSTREVWTP